MMHVMHACCSSHSSSMAEIASARYRHCRCQRYWEFGTGHQTDTCPGRAASRGASVRCCRKARAAVMLAVGRAVTSALKPSIGFTPVAATVDFQD